MNIKEHKVPVLVISLPLSDTSSNGLVIPKKSASQNLRNVIAAAVNPGFTEDPNMTMIPTKVTVSLTVG